MIDTTDTAEFERKKKLFTFLPLFAVPILVLLFWALGGGQSSAAEVADGRGPVSQVNTDLPGAIVEREGSKRDVYEQEEKERERRKYALSRDPYAAQLQSEDGRGSAATGIEDWEQRFSARTGNLQRELDSFDEIVTESSGPSAPEPTTPSSSTQRSKARSRQTTTSPRSIPSTTLNAEEEDEQVRQIEQAIAKLNGGSDPLQDVAADSYGSSFAPVGGTPSMGSDDGGLSMTAQDSAAIKQVEALDRIMERATYLQYPELAEEEMRKRSQKNAKHLYPVADAPTAAGDVKIFGSAPRRDTVPPAARRQAGFFTDNSDDQSGDFTQLTVQAQVHNSVVVMDGSTVKMRLLEDVYVAGERIPANTFVYGQAGLRGDRLRVTVSTITYRNNVYDVGLNVYDLDGQPGLAVPGSVERQIAKREAAAAAQNLGGAGNGGGSLTAQLAAEGAQTIKEITSRKIRVIKVELKAGHRVILRNQ